MTPEQMDSHFDQLQPGPRANKDRHEQHPDFLSLRDFISERLRSYERDDEPLGSVSWINIGASRFTTCKLVYYAKRPWLFGVRREVARLCPQLAELVDRRFWVQSREFVGIEVQNDGDSRAVMAAMAQVVREDENACDLPQARIASPSTTFESFRTRFESATAPDPSFPSLRIYSRNGELVTGASESDWLDSWLRLAPPAAKDKHWRDGRSSKELARCWYHNAGNRDVLPSDVNGLLSAWQFSPAFGIAEFRGGLDGFKGNTRNHDLIVLGTSAINVRTLVAVEAKADEPFGTDLIEGYRERGVQKYGSQIPARIDRLIAALFGRLITPEIAKLRRFKCTRALFLVHEFRSKRCDPGKLANNARDLRDFVTQLAKNSPTLGIPPNLEPRFLIGPFRVHGDAPARLDGYHLPDSIELFIGKLVTELA